MLKLYLAWTGAPQGTKSFALIVEDPDAPKGTWVHWVAFNIPGTQRALPAGASRGKAKPAVTGMIEGKNSGGHPGYVSMSDPDANDPDAPRITAQQDPWHYSIARMVDACTAVGALPFYGPFGDIKDVAGCEAQFRAAFLLGCVGAWSLHPVQIGIAKKVFSPDPEEVAFAKKVIEAIPDGRGVHMIDGKMQDDATWKQCKVMVDLAESLAARDPELAEAYGMAGAAA
jgi:hypothetical protein